MDVKFEFSKGVYGFDFAENAHVVAVSNVLTAALEQEGCHWNSDQFHVTDNQGLIGEGADKADEAEGELDACDHRKAHLGDLVMEEVWSAKGR